MQETWERRDNKRAHGRKKRTTEKKEPTRASLSTRSPEEKEKACPGLVVGIGRQSISVLCNDVVYACSRSTAETNDLAVGDHVRVLPLGEEQGEIVERMERKNALTRIRLDRSRSGSGGRESHIVAANIDYGVIVCAAKQPAFHPRFVDRFLVVMQASGVSPILCINKSELGSILFEIESLYAGLAMPILEVSAQTGLGIEQLKSLLRSKVAVFVGQSGVGKSSLTKLFVPEKEIAVQEVSHKRGAGKHTTTASTVYAWEKESFLIDTPGIRSLGIEHIPQRDLPRYFSEFTPFASQCSFRTCLHISEPGCAVKDAVEKGNIHPARYQSYLRLFDE